MNRVLALSLFLLQGIPVQQGGTVTGFLRDEQGAPVPGVRVAAMAKSGIAEEALGGAMSGLAETDELGRFILENIPPGRYSIAAGRLDRQTYHPGTPSADEATVFTIAPGTVIEGVLFVLVSASFGRAAINPLAPAVMLGIAEIPLKVAAEAGGKFPLSANGKFVTVRVSATAAPSARTAPVDSAVVTVPGPVTSDYRVGVVNLPDNWVVKSINYGATDITRGTFRLIPANFSNDPAAPLLPQGLVSVVLAPPGPVTPPLPVSITLGRSGSAAPVAGVNVTGRSGSTGGRLISISGSPGTFFSDGTFELAGVLPGRHVIITTSNPSRPMAAIVAVGDQSLQNIELTEIPLIPVEARQKEPLPLGDLIPGTTMPLARLSVTIIEEVSGQVVSDGELIVKTADFSRTIRPERSGQFEPLHMLPGKYDLTFQSFGHTSTNETIVVEDKDTALVVKLRKLY
jgi:hypothetical protein